jgi:hypothetical protein
MADPGSAFTDVACDAGRWNLLGVVPLTDITTGIYTTKPKRVNYLSQLSSLPAPCFNDTLKTANFYKQILDLIILEQEKTSIAMQWFGKHTSVAKNRQTIVVELLEAVPQDSEPRMTVRAVMQRPKPRMTVLVGANNLPDQLSLWLEASHKPIRTGAAEHLSYKGNPYC